MERLTAWVRWRASRPLVDARDMAGWVLAMERWRARKPRRRQPIPRAGTYEINGSVQWADGRRTEPPLRTIKFPADAEPPTVTFVGLFQAPRHFDPEELERDFTKYRRKERA